MHAYRVGITDSSSTSTTTRLQTRGKMIRTTRKIRMNTRVTDLPPASPGGCSGRSVWGQSVSMLTVQRIHLWLLNPWTRTGRRYQPRLCSIWKRMDGCCQSCEEHASTSLFQIWTAGNRIYSVWMKFLSYRPFSAF